jgi:hypothetical protein
MLPLTNNNSVSPLSGQLGNVALNCTGKGLRRSLMLKLFTLTALVLTLMFLSARLVQKTSAATRALVPEEAGIHFISFTTWHIGDGGAGALPGTYAGQTKIFDITAADYDTEKPAIITMRVKEVNSPCNQVMFESINVGPNDQTVHVANPIPNHTEDLSDWHTVTLEIPSNTFKKVSTRRLWITARNNDCGWSGGLDDFLVDTVVLHYVRK